MNSQAVTCTFRQAVKRRTCTEHERVIAFTDVDGAANAKRSSFLCEHRFLVLDLIERATQRPASGSYTKRKLPFNQICKVSKAQLGVTVSAVPQIWSCEQSCLFLFFSPPWVVLGGIFFPQLPPHTLWPTSLTFLLLAHCFTSVWARASELHHCFIWIKLWSWGVIYLHSVCV